MALSKMKIAYVTSEGGHLTELLYLSSKINGPDDFFVTFESPRTLALPIKKYLVPDFWSRPTKIISAMVSMIKIIHEEKPDVMISTGSEIAIPFFYLGKLLGIKTVFIESYTRVNEATITGMLVYPLTNIFLVNWEELLPKYGKRAKFWGSMFRPCKKNDTISSEDKNQILALVGMNFRTFDRLLKVMDDVAKHTNNKVLIQLGSSQFKPGHAEYFDYKPYSEVLQLIKGSKALVCQGAMCAVDGLINGCNVIVVPRSSKYGEVINDHQIVFSEKLASMGLLRTAYDLDNVEACLQEEGDPDRPILQINDDMINKLLGDINALK